MYRELDDNELLFMVEENQDYYDILLEKYKPLIVKISNKYSSIAKKVGFELDDLIQIGYLGLMEAIKYFEDSRKVMFYTYIAKCIENKIKLEIKSQCTLKRKMLNDTISYNEVVKNTNKTLLDVIENKNAINPCEQIIINELEEKYIQIIQSLPLEIAVAYEMKIDGFGNDQISNFLRIDNKDVIRFVNYAKKKMKLS